MQYDVYFGTNNAQRPISFKIANVPYLVNLGQYFSIRVATNQDVSSFQFFK